uniref:Tc1-like transposase DDE domain-containing protein n=1 Tax=Amphimedon queenslandica TaxID=400682 RepID=A0A1X7TIL7_AMPQE
MIVWLVYYGEEFFDDDCTMSQLFSIVLDAAKKMGLTTTKYIVDEMALKARHVVVRLPVAHCTLNPIELAWAQVKGHIKVNTSKFTLDEFKSLAEAGFDVVSKE